MNTENELFGELHEQEEYGLFGNEHKRQHEEQQEALRLSAVVGRSEQLKAFIHFAEFTKQECGIHIPLNLINEYVKSL